MHPGYYNSYGLSQAWKLTAINNLRKTNLRDDMIKSGLIKPAKLLA